MANIKCLQCGQQTGPAFGLCEDCIKKQDESLKQQAADTWGQIDAAEQEDLRPRAFTNPKTGISQICRLDPGKLAVFEGDPYTRHYGVDTGEFIRDWRRKDIADGCPFCRQEVEDNLSEPDVMSRWGFRG